MGQYHSCRVDTTRTCPSFLQDAIQCENGGAARGPLGWQARELKDACWYQTDRVVLYIVLPILFFLIALIATWVIYKFNKLRTIRQSRQQRPYQLDSRFELIHGHYAAGADEWTFDHDVLPYLVPSFMRRFCIVNPAPIRWMMTIAVVTFFLLVPLFLSLGLSTRNHTTEQNELNGNPYGLTIAGIALLPLSIVLCCISLIARSCCSRWKRDRLKRMEQLNYAESGIYPAESISESVIDVEAIPMIQLGEANNSFHDCDDNS